ncbi:MAG: hypothetical protein H6707_11395 [Deltaproteobacteria bacterium]|nr:hypothetical protein [Deltaproteobacteria bacterium]
MMRVLLFCLFGFVALILAGTLTTTELRIGVPIVIVLYCAASPQRRVSATDVRGSLLSADGVAVALVLGYLSDLLGGGSPGVESFSLASVYVVAAFAGRVFALRRMSGMVIASFLAVLAVHFVSASLSAMLGYPVQGVWRLALPSGVVTALLAPLVVRGLRWIEQRFGQQHEQGSRLRFE